nr:hypothetical protein [Tanacetum cinerariifolium]
MGVPEDIYAAVDSCETTQEIWLCVQQMMKEYGNRNGYNAVQNPFVQNVVENLGVQNVGNHNGLIVVPGIANPNANQNRNDNVVATRAEGNGNGNNKNQIQCYNCRGLGDLKDIDEECKLHFDG